MISPWRWGRWKPKARERRISLTAAPDAMSTASAPLTSELIQNRKSEIPGRTMPRTMPRPVLRWVAEGRIALRAFDFDADVETICSFQPETYGLNFPDFHYSADFATAFRHDLRRAVLDPYNGLFVLDDGRETKTKNGHLLGFLWIVVCRNNWTGERYGYINNIYIAPSRRGQGLGEELLRQADEWFRSRGVKTVRLTVTSSNGGAIALYEKSGYHVQRWEMEKEL
jgi:ribosomal protein S18 acetylase RimI-like enzyme